MSDATIFDAPAGKTTSETGETANTQLALPDEVKELIGEGKKYKSPEDALKSVPHAQRHILTLEQELAAAREELAKARTSEEVYATVKEMLATGGRPPEGGKQAEPLDLEAVLDRKLQEREARAAANANVATVKQVLVAQFGDKAAEVYSEKAKQLGIGVEFLNDLCARSPNAAFELLGVKPGSGDTKPAMRSSVNTELLKPNEAPKPKSVMGGAKTSDVIEAWRAAKPK